MASSNNIGMSINQPSIPIFDGENYDYWSIKMKTLFISQEIWELVENGYEEPSTPTNQQREQLKDNKKKDAKALFFIQQAVSDKIFSRIIRATKSKEAWNILQEEFQGNTKVRAIKLQTLRRELDNLRMQENEKLKDYFSKIMEIVNQMKSYGETITEQKICEKILVSLPPKFDTIVTILEESKDLSMLSVHELIGSLEAHEQRLFRHNESSIESAFQSKLKVFDKSSQRESFRGGNQNRGGGRNMRGRGRGRQRNNLPRRQNDESTQQRCNICKRSSHVEKDCWFRGKPQCYNCKKFGHIQKDCRYQPSEQAHFSEENESEQSTFYACQTAEEQRNDVWYLDSGCSNHMTGDKSIFVDINSSSISQVKMENGVLVQARGKGTIAINTKKGRKFIHDVLLVPNLK